MKFMCGECNKEEAQVFCCADQAALCLGCDVKIHAANKLVSKHQRVSLSTSSSSLPKCDICQETTCLFLCLEDRALLCRKCDVAIHTMNSVVPGHQRFLHAGVKVGLESAELGKPTDNKVKIGRDSLAAGLPKVSTSHKYGSAVEGLSHGDPKMAAVSTVNATTSDSDFDDILALIDSNNNNNPSSQEVLPKAAEGKVPGNSEWWKILRSTEAELLNDDWAVPEVFL